MTIDQAKLDRIKASLASDAKAEGVSFPMLIKSDDYGTFYLSENGCSIANGLSHTDAAFIARARTTVPAMATLLLDEILWLEYEIIHCGYIEMREAFRNRLASIVNGWPESLPPPPTP